MKKQKLKTGFSRYTDTVVDLLTAYILICMTGNTYFPNPTPTLAQLAESLARFRSALEGAKTRASLAIAQKNAARQELESLLKALGLYIMSVASGDGLALASTGYPMTKVPGPRTISNPGFVSLGRGDSSGEMVASVKPEQPSPGYIFQISNADPAAEGETVWNSMGSTVNKCRFTGLVSGSKYWVRVIAIGARGQMVLGPVSSEFAV